MGIPYRQLETLLVDVGNTLLEMDYGLFAERVGRAGLPLTSEHLRRAEAAVRPRVSKRLEAGQSTEAESSFAEYMRLMLERAASEARPPLEADSLSRAVEALVALRREPQAALRIWSVLRPDARPFLAAIREAGLKIVVISNSDGTVEQSLCAHGLSEFLTGVVDSHHFGAEKPDPAIFRRALEFTGSAPERALHVGDMHAIDVVGAARAGCHAVLLDPFSDWEGWDCERVSNLRVLAARVAGAD